jgi:histidinol dehydrogenase
LFVAAKVCLFDCPYCEVFPFRTEQQFSLDVLENELMNAFKTATDTVKDICLSGNGEPTLSMHLSDVLDSAFCFRDTFAPKAQVVVITSGMGLFDNVVFNLLHRAATGKDKLVIWLKVDAGTDAWYQKINRGQASFKELNREIECFIRTTPVIIQTMICAVNGEAPPPDECSAWLDRVTFLVAIGMVKGVHIYGKCRPAPEDPLASALPVSLLEERAAALSLRLVGTGIPVQVFP